MEKTGQLRVLAALNRHVIIGRVEMVSSLDAVQKQKHLFPAGNRTLITRVFVDITTNIKISQNGDRIKLIIGYNFALL
jgi:hypothetical protein